MSIYDDDGNIPEGPDGSGLSIPAYSIDNYYEDDAEEVRRQRQRFQEGFYDRYNSELRDSINLGDVMRQQQELREQQASNNRQRRALEQRSRQQGRGYRIRQNQEILEDSFHRNQQGTFRPAENGFELYTGDSYEYEFKSGPNNKLKPKQKRRHAANPKYQDGEEVLLKVKVHGSFQEDDNSPVRTKITIDTGNGQTKTIEIDEDGIFNDAAPKIFLNKPKRRLFND